LPRGNAWSDALRHGAEQRAADWEEHSAEAPEATFPRGSMGTIKALGFSSRSVTCIRREGAACMVFLQVQNGTCQGEGASAASDLAVRTVGEFASPSPKRQ